MSTVLVFGVLTLGWGAYLAYWWRESRASRGRSDAIQDFSRRLDRLNGSPRPTLRANGSLAFEIRPRTVADAALRRQQIIMALSVAAFLSLLGALAFGLLALAMHLVIDAALGTFLYAVLRRRNLAAEREIKVQMLYPEGVTSLTARRERQVGS